MRNEVTTRMGRRLPESQEELLMLMNEKEEVAIVDVPDRMEEVRELIDEGYAQLAAVAYPWGVELRLAPTRVGSFLIPGRERQ